MRLTLRTALALAVPLLAGACGSWPAPGQGGMAEFATPAPAGAPETVPLQRHLTCSLQRAAVVSQAAQQAGQNTGRVALLDTVAARAQREVAGGLPGDAARTLTQLDRDVDVLGVALRVAPVPPDPRHCTA